MGQNNQLRTFNLNKEEKYIKRNKPAGNAILVFKYKRTIAEFGCSRYQNQPQQRYMNSAYPLHLCSDITTQSKDSTYTLRRQRMLCSALECIFHGAA